LRLLLPLLLVIADLRDCLLQQLDVCSFLSFESFSVLEFRDEDQFASAISALRGGKRICETLLEPLLEEIAFRGVLVMGLVCLLASRLTNLFRF
jgi:hypothetical protein